MGKAEKNRPSKKQIKSSIRVRKFDKDALIPEKKHANDVGYDLASVEEVIIPAGETRLISTGIGITPPSRYYGQIFSRSGLAARFGLIVLGGVIDPGFTGAVQVILHNTSKDSFTVKKGNRIAQIVFLLASTAPVVEIFELDETDRADRGFGSTGVSSNPRKDK